MRLENIRKAVRERYGAIAAGKGTKKGCGCGTGSSCCSSVGQVASTSLGYDAKDLAAIPKDADLGLGCGNPLAIDTLSPGETVLDLGSGGGIDCFLAAKKVGDRGRVIGVDMTAEMIDLARENARKMKAANVEFRLGEIEHLPVADKSVDVIISNCVINLSPDKRQTFAEAYRVLKPGGRLMVSDIVLKEPLPKQVLESVESYVGCVAGASLLDDYLGAARGAGFTEVKVTGERQLSPDDVDLIGEQMSSKRKLSKDEIRKLSETVVSAKVFARKP